MSAKLLVVAGAPLQASEGETFLPSAVHCVGIMPPSSKALLVTCMAGTPSSSRVALGFSAWQPNRTRTEDQRMNVRNTGESLPGTWCVWRLFYLVRGRLTRSQ